MSATARQRSQLLSPNDDEVRMRHHPFHLALKGALLPRFHEQFYISYAYSSYNSFGWFSKRSSYVGAPTGCFSLRRSMVCLLVGSIAALSVSERSLKADLPFQITWSCQNF